MVQSDVPLLSLPVEMTDINVRSGGWDAYC